MRERLAAAVACALWAGPVCPAQPAPASSAEDSARGTVVVQRPASAGRVTRRFGFEEQTTNPTDLPMHWIRAQHDPPSRERPGFPIWNRGVLDYNLAASGAGSVRLPTRGGSASLLLDPGVVPVFPEADYTVSAMVRTSEVSHARARLVARLLDGAGRAIPSSEVSSQFVQTRGSWRELSVRVRGDWPQAASLQIELLLEQPGPAGRLPFRELEVVPEDFTGAAWFDDVTVMQVPRVELWAEPAGNLFNARERPALSLFLRDLVGEPLRVRFELFDLDGRRVAREEFAFAGGRLERDWLPPVDRYGWYTARVSVWEGEAAIGAASTALLWRGPGSGRGEVRTTAEGLLSVAIDGVPARGLGELADVALRTGVTRIQTDLWFEGEPVSVERRNALAAVANTLTPRNHELAIGVATLPPEIAGLGGVTGLVGSLAEAGSDGAAWFDPLLIDLGHRVRRWRLGRPGESIGLGRAEVAAAAADRLRDMVPGAVLGVPVSPFERVDPVLAGPGVSVVQRLDAGVPIEEIRAVVASFVDASGGGFATGWDVPEHVVVLDARDGAGAPRRAALERLVLAGLHARLAFDEQSSVPGRARSLRLDGAWAWQEGRRAELAPSPAVGPWLTLSEMLTGRRGESLPPIAPGVEGALLTPRDGSSRAPSVLVLWPAVTADAPRSVRARLAEGAVRVIDLFGNAAMVEPRQIGETDLLAHGIDLSDGPVFVEGVDPELVRFIASLRAEPGLIETRVDGAETELVVSNPWRAPIRGDYYIVEPGNMSEGDIANRDRSWDIMPRHGSFVADPGETVRLPISVDTSPAVHAGEHPLVVDVKISAPSIEGGLRVERTIEAGLSDLDLDLVYRFGPEPDGPDLVVYAIVTNRGAAARTVHLYAGAADYPRQRSAPMPVSPGRPSVKVFAFEGGRDALAGGEVTVGLFIREAGERLRRHIEIDGGR